MGVVGAVGGDEVDFSKVGLEAFALARLELTPTACEDIHAGLQGRSVIERNGLDRTGGVEVGLIVGDEVDQSDIVEVLVLVPVGVADHPVDPVCRAFVAVDVRCAEPHAMAVL